MYYLAKFLELFGMITIGISFFISFPELMNWNYFIVGIAFFCMGFMIEKFVLK